MKPGKLVAAVSLELGSRRLVFKLPALRVDVAAQRAARAVVTVRGVPRFALAARVLRVVLSTLVWVASMVGVKSRLSAGVCTR